MFAKASFMALSWLFVFPYEDTPAVCSAVDE